MIKITRVIFRRFYMKFLLTTLASQMRMNISCVSKAIFLDSFDDHIKLICACRNPVIFG